jgi:hypothetical protein
MHLTCIDDGILLVVGTNFNDLYIFDQLILKFKIQRKEQPIAAMLMSEWFHFTLIR